MTWRTVIAAVLLFIGGMATGSYLNGDMRLVAVYPSPDKRERLELYTPPRWQRPWFEIDPMPTIARLTQISDETLVADSGVFDFGGGVGDQIYWTKDGVQISTIAVYRRSTGRWETGQ